ncbi:hypothetical protein WDU94_011872 [Cyamophila willieti]
MGWSKLVCKLSAVFVVFWLHVLVNIINRVIIEIFYSDSDPDKSILNCSFLVMVIVFALLTLKPCNYARYARFLVGAEIFMQVLHLLWLAQLQCLLIGDILPFLEKYWIGQLALYKIALLVATLYILWLHFLANIEFKICWTPPPDDSWDCASASEWSSQSSQQPPKSPKPSSQCPSCGPSSCPPPPPCCWSPRACGDC